MISMFGKEKANQEAKLITSPFSGKILQNHKHPVSRESSSSITPSERTWGADRERGGVEERKRECSPSATD